MYGDSLNYGQDVDEMTQVQIAEIVKAARAGAAPRPGYVALEDYQCMDYAESQIGHALPEVVVVPQTGWTHYGEMETW